MSSPPPTRLPPDSPPATSVASAPRGRGFGAVLREATRAEHVAVEETLPLMAPDVTADTYRKYLALTFGYYEPIEASLAAVPGWEAQLPDAALRRKLPRLREDLDYLGVTEEALGALPRCGRLPPLGSLAEAFGCAYVLEGSTLGGQFLARHLRATLGEGGAGRAAFFTSYGAEVGAMWRAFGARLDAYAVDHPGETDAIVGSARATFATLTAWLRGGPER